MSIPQTPYVALYGTHSGDWRTTCSDLLSANSINWYNSVDERWKNITEKNGDQMQSVIDNLVAKQQEALLRSACVVFHLSSHYFADTGRNGTERSLAARCELGFLIGTGIRTFAHIEPDAEGRNYLWAAMKASPLMFRCGTLNDAINAAITYMLQRSSATT